MKQGIKAIREKFDEMFFKCQGEDCYQVSLIFIWNIYTTPNLGQQNIRSASSLLNGRRYWWLAVEVRRRKDGYKNDEEEGDVPCFMVCKSLFCTWFRIIIIQERSITEILVIQRTYEEVLQSASAPPCCWIPPPCSFSQGD